MIVFGGINLDGLLKTLIAVFETGINSYYNHFVNKYLIFI